MLLLHGKDDTIVPFAHSVARERAMRAAGVGARLEVHEAMSHAEYSAAFESPESAVVFSDIAAFFDAHLAR